MGICPPTVCVFVFIYLFVIVQVVRETWGSSGRHMRDYTLYTGILGTAYLVFKAYQVTENRSDLNLCSEIVKACDSASEDSRYSLSLSLSFNASEAIIIIT